jgi:hypothetical protein
MAAVALNKRDEALTFLGDDDVVAITPAQARDLTALATNLDETLDSLIERRQGKLRILETDPAQLTQPGHSDTVARLQRQIADYKTWRHNLRPYLLKGVSLNDQGLGFHATLYGKTLFVDQISAVGDKQVPMQNMSIVAFLPCRPDKIYTTFTTFR